MEDKAFELLTKMYGEFTDFKSEIKEQFIEVNQKVENLSNQFTLFENGLKPKIETALDGYKVVYEKLNTLEEKVDNISSKVEKQDVEIRVIKSAK